MLNPLTYIAQYESGHQNIYQQTGATNSTASGYFQITNSTWGGIPSSITGGYSTAMSAPVDVQANAAAYLYNQQGFSPWASYNPSLSAAISSAGGASAFGSPDAVAYASAYGGSGSSTGWSSPPGDYGSTYANAALGGSSGGGISITADPSFSDPSAGGNAVAPGGANDPGGSGLVPGGALTGSGTASALGGLVGAITGGSSGTGTGFWNWAQTATSDFFVRWGVFVIGIVLLLGAVMAFGWGEQKGVLPKYVTGK